MSRFDKELVDEKVLEVFEFFQAIRTAPKEMESGMRKIGGNKAFICLNKVAVLKST